MSKFTIAKIRPISWKVVVQGEQAAEYIRELLADKKFETTPCEKEPDLADPPLFAFQATPRSDDPVTATELQAILKEDPQVELTFDVS